MIPKMLKVMLVVAAVLIGFGLAGFLDRAMPAQVQTPAAKPDAPKPLSDTDARAFQRLQVIVLESRITLGALEKEFVPVKDRHDQTVAQLQELLSRLRRQYHAEGCDLDKDLGWVSVDPKTKQAGSCVPRPELADGAEKPNLLKPEQK